MKRYVKANSSVHAMCYNHGLSDEAIDSEQDYLRKKYPSRPGEKIVMSDEDEWRDEELWARAMVNSILCYYTKPEKCSTPEGRQQVLQDIKYGYSRRYLYDNEYPVLTENAIDTLVLQQAERYSKAVLHTNVATDSEGCSYNSIEW